jgi:hypothetical protein
MEHKMKTSLFRICPKKLHNVMCNHFKFGHYLQFLGVNSSVHSQTYTIRLSHCLWSLFLVTGQNATI